MDKLSNNFAKKNIGKRIHLKNMIIIIFVTFSLKKAFFFNYDDFDIL